MNQTNMAKLLMIVGTFMVIVLGFPSSAQAASTYQLEPSHPAVNMPVSQPNTGFGVNVLLKKQGELVKNQQNFRYEWSIVNGADVVSIFDEGFASGCPYDVQSPCPNLHASLKGLKPGVAEVSVSAYENNRLQALTTFFVVVQTQPYVLEFAGDQPVEMVLRNPGVYSYGLNSLLKKDGELVKDQRTMKYEWKVAKSPDEVVTLNTYGYSDCSDFSYGFLSPCPNFRAELAPVSVGTSYVVAIAKSNQGVPLAAAAVPVNVTMPSNTQPTSTPTPSPRPSSSPVVYPSASPTPSPSPIVVPSPDPNKEGIIELQNKVDQLSKQLEQQAQRQSRLERLVQRLLSMFGGWFK